MKRAGIRGIGNDQKWFFEDSRILTNFSQNKKKQFADTVGKVFQNNDRILAFVIADPSLNGKE